MDDMVPVTTHYFVHYMLFRSKLVDLDFRVIKFVYNFLLMLLVVGSECKTLSFSYVLKTTVSGESKNSRLLHKKILKGGSPVLAAQELPRRAILPLIGVNMLFANVCTVFAAPVKEMKEPEILRILKFASGVRIQDIVEGQGQEASEGDLVEFNYVCRRSNGYFVHSSVDQFSGESSPVILPLDDKQIIKGLKEVLIGMKVGGKRRASIPPSAGYVSETLQPIPKEFGPRRSLLSHIKEPLVFEVQLLKVL